MCHSEEGLTTASLTNRTYLQIRKTPKILEILEILLAASAQMKGCQAEALDEGVWRGMGVDSGGTWGRELKGMRVYLLSTCVWHSYTVTNKRSVAR